METISAKELKQYACEGRCLIIDLRSVEEYRREHVPGALNVPQGNFHSELSCQKGGSVILYCDRGALSMSVARELEKRGYRAKSVVGGFRAYKGLSAGDST